jgi:HK97 family phage portal protein
MGWLAQARQTLSSLITPPGGFLGGVFTVQDPFPGAWQQNQELTAASALSYVAVYACLTQIAQDVGKTTLRLVKNDGTGIWTPVDNPAWSPVLRKPNAYQTIVQFKHTWITSKLAYGNTYVLKTRDQRGVVAALDVLDPQKVRPLIAPDGAVYYELGPRDTARPDARPVGLDPDRPVVPASEMIHDLMIPLFHPLVGVSPLYACGVAALQGQTIQQGSSRFFANGSNPGGLLVIPGALDPEQLKRVQESWNTAHAGVNQGRVAILTGGMKYESMTMSAIDAQLIDQLKMTEQQVCAAFHVPPYLVGVGDPPPYGTVEPLVQQYYASCLQSLLTAFEVCLDEGLELPTPYGTEFDLTDLILMDAATRTKAAHDAISAGALSPNEARRRYFGLGDVAGGESPYLQHQDYPLAALADRPAPGAEPTPPPAAPVAAPVAGQAALAPGAVLTAARAALVAKGLLEPCHT